MNAIAIDMVGLDELQWSWAQAPDIARAELAAAMTEADSLLEREVKEATPTAHGLLRGSIFGVEEVSATQVLGVVGTAMQHAIPVELGSKPHFPPIEPLIDWVRVKLGITGDKEAKGVAFAIARTIASRGTLGVGMFHRTFARLQPQLNAIFARARDRIVARLAGKA
ncbi:MAG: hypothetical protein M0015_02925 [Betaproteobacteria bacterium]|nr:hypothetical protein [Betaproteobacteria bacterium]